MKFLISILAILIIASTLFAQNVQFTGDFRYRYATTMIENQTNTGQALLRARVNAEWTANDNITLITRFSTGDTRARFASTPISLDRAYVNYHTTAQLHGVEHPVDFAAGKMPIPFYNTTAHFDADLNFDGVAIRTSDDRLFFNAGGFWINQSAEPGNQGVTAGQVGTTLGQFIGAIAYYHYLNVQDHTWLYNGTYGYGNATQNGTYVYDYHIVDVNAAYPIGVLTFGANYMQNVALSENNTAWAIGADANLTSWTFSAWYSETKPEAILGALADDENGGGTDAKSLMLAAYLTPLEHTRLGAKYFNSQFCPWVDACAYSDQRAYIDLELNF